MTFRRACDIIKPILQVKKGGNKRKLDFDISYYSSLGGRQNNEDVVSVKHDEKSLLIIVADGLGGHADAEVASLTAVESMNKELIGNEPSVEALGQAVENANLAVLGKNDYSSMKTTVAALWLSKEMAVISTAGDTRVYCFRKGEIIFQSVDHSLSQLAVISGDITADEIRGHIDRNKLIRVLGVKENVNPDLNVLEAKSGDAFLLCSDGFWENIIEKDMIKTLSAAKRSDKWMTEMKLIVNSTANDDCDNNSAVAVILK